MNRKKILLALDAHQELHLERQFVESYFSNPGSLMVGLFVSGKAQPRELAARTQALYQAWAEGFAGGPPPVDFQIHREKYNGPDQLHQELRYADALLIRRSLLDDLQAHQPDLLHQLSFGPVIILPERPEAIKQVVLVYDGSYEAWMAIKQFVFLFPALCQAARATAVIPCQGSDITGDTQGERLLIEYLRCHFRDLGIHKVCDTDRQSLYHAIDFSMPTLISGSGTHLSYLWEQAPQQEVTHMIQGPLTHS